jgi:hypothetical protein
VIVHFFLRWILTRGTIAESPRRRLCGEVIMSAFARYRSFSYMKSRVFIASS